MPRIQRHPVKKKPQGPPEPILTEREEKSLSDQTKTHVILANILNPSTIAVSDVEERKKIITENLRSEAIASGKGVVVEEPVIEEVPDIPEEDDIESVQGSVDLFSRAIEDDEKFFREEKEKSPRKKEAEAEPEKEIDEEPEEKEKEDVGDEDVKSEPSVAPSRSTTSSHRMSSLDKMEDLLKEKRKKKKEEEEERKSERSASTRSVSPARSEKSEPNETTNTFNPLFYRSALLQKKKLKEKPQANEDSSAAVGKKPKANVKAQLQTLQAQRELAKIQLRCKEICLLIGEKIEDKIPEDAEQEAWLFLLDELKKDEAKFSFGQRTKRFTEYGLFGLEKLVESTQFMGLHADGLQKKIEDKWDEKYKPNMEKLFYDDRVPKLLKDMPPAGNLLMDLFDDFKENHIDVTKNEAMSRFAEEAKRGPSRPAGEKPSAPAAGKSKKSSSIPPPPPTEDKVAYAEWYYQHYKPEEYKAMMQKKSAKMKSMARSAAEHKSKPSEEADEEEKNIAAPPPLIEDEDDLDLFNNLLEQEKNKK